MKFRPATASQSRTIEVPGPGQYNPNVSKTQTQGGRIGTAKRSGLDYRSSEVPGPGHFNIGDDWGKKLRHPGFGESKRCDVASSKEGPGPGNYNPDERRSLASAPAYTMGGGALRKSAADKSSMPGPGAYNPRVDYSKENPGSIKIGTSPRNSKFNTEGVPGPGNYNVTGRLGGPAYGIGTGSRSNSKHD